jgi:hypothetical protein
MVNINRPSLRARRSTKKHKATERRRGQRRLSKNRLQDRLVPLHDILLAPLPRPLRGACLLVVMKHSAVGNVAQLGKPHEYWRFRQCKKKRDEIIAALQRLMVYFQNRETKKVTLELFVQTTVGRARHPSCVPSATHARPRPTTCDLAPSNTRAPPTIRAGHVRPACCRIRDA